MGAIPNVTLLALAERCEHAPVPDRAADYDIAHFVTRAHLENHGKAPAYTASLDAAMTLVPEGLAMGFKMAPCQRAHAMLATIGEEWSGSGSTPALALCAAGLRAHAATSEAGDAQ